jgi:hypothetical protein
MGQRRVAKPERRELGAEAQYSCGVPGPPAQTHCRVSKVRSATNKNFLPTGRVVQAQRVSAIEHVKPRLRS